MSDPNIQCDRPQTVCLSLRDYFAARAMTGLIEGYEYEIREKSMDKAHRTGFDDFMYDSEDSGTTFAEGLAVEAYIIADAMLKQREKPALKSAESLPVIEDADE